MASAISFAGLATGIDTSKIIDSLTAFNSRRIQALQNQKTAILEQRTTFSDLRAKLLDLQTQTGRLARSIAGAFDGKVATSSDNSALSAAASTTASAGTYTLTVQSLAAVHQLASQGFADPSTNIKTGTLTLKVGNGPSTTVTIDGANNTLQGLADAINAAGGEVQASIINDGTATPYRLLLTANRSGAQNTIQITNNLTNGSGASIDPAASTVQAASDARVTIGSGAGAVTVSSETNRFDNLIAGVTVNVSKADASKPITLTVANDSTGAADAIQAFVDSYNAVIEYIDQRDSYDTVTKEAGILLGNRDSDDLRRDLNLILRSAVPLVSANANRASTVGLTFDDNGRLQFNRSRFEDVFNGKIAGVGAGDVKRLFALTGTSTSSGVKFLLGGSKTKPTSAGAPYQVDVTQAATRAAITAANDLAESTVITTSNNAFTIKINNQQSSTLTLAAGTYSRAALASAIQTAIKADTALSGAQVIVDLSGNKLRVTSQAYGANSQASIGTGSAISSGILGFSGSESAVGQNVAGSFIVNGVTEAAVGIGQILSGNSGNANTDGLQVQVTLTTGQIVSGSDADIHVTSGLADRLNQLLSRYIDPVTGRLQAVDKRYTTQAEAITQSIVKQNEFLEAKKSSLLKQFAAMEQAVGRLNSLSQQLSLQFLVPSSRR